MAPPVWVLSVDLQTKTATFQSDMVQAARSARGAFGEIRSGVGEMAVGVSKGSIDVRHSLGLVDNVIRGAHAQAMADLVRMYAQSAVVMSTLPIAAAAAGIALIGGIAYEAAEHIKKMKEATEKLGNALTEQNTSGNNAFRQLDDEILKAEQHADELRNDHLGALKTELELIDHQSLDQLARSFDTVAKNADNAFKQAQAGWFSSMLGDSGSTGPAHALEQFKVQYENLISLGKNKDASDLLRGSLESARHILAMQQQMIAMGAGHTGMSQAQVDAAWEANRNSLKAAGIGYSNDEVEAQQALVTALQQQVSAETRVNELKKINTGNATGSARNAAAHIASAAAKEAAAARLSIGQSALAGEKATADAQLTIHHASIEQRLQSDLDFAKRERDMKEAANQADIAGLNKSGNDYQVQLKTLNDKALQIQQEYSTRVATLKATATIAENQRDTQALEQGIRAQIDATDQGSAARLAAIDAGIREEQARHLQDTSFYKSLLTERVTAARQEAEQETKLSLQSAEVQARRLQELAQEEARHHIQMLQIQSASSGGLADFGRISLERQQMAIEFQLKRQALEQELELYKQAGQEKVKQAQQTAQQLELLDKQYADKAKELDAQKKQDLHKAWADIANGYAQMFMQVLEGHQSLTAAMGRLADEAANKMIAASIQVMAGNKSEQLSNAEVAASGAYKAMAGIPIIGPELGAVAAAAVFAGAMAFNKGGIVPGVGHGDTVPALLTPGEGVVPGGVMDGLQNVSRNGGFHQAPSTIHVDVRPTYNVQTIDGDGMSAALEKHSDQLEQHFHNAVRKMNR